MRSPKVIVALDGISQKRALAIARKLCKVVWGFKVNDLLYEDIGIIKKLKQFGKVFVDVKLHDIPNTAGNTARKLSRLGADIITVHASGGVEMMRVAKKNTSGSKVIAVTVLTSKERASAEAMKSLVSDAVRAGVDGVVCSGREVAHVRAMKGMKSKLVVVPGIRPAYYRKRDDQKCAVTPQEAMRAGADLLVIGRPILETKNPLSVCVDIQLEIEGKL